MAQDLSSSGYDGDVDEVRGNDKHGPSSSVQAEIS